jgi:hypothetical protein
MKREFVVVENEDEYEEVILSLAAIEVRFGGIAIGPQGRAGQRAVWGACLQGEVHRAPLSEGVPLPS